MRVLTTTKNAVCHGAYLAILGLLCVLLAGPVLAILGVMVSLVVAGLSVLVGVFSAVLPFILIGFMAYLPLYMLRSKTPAWCTLGLVTGRMFNSLVVRPCEASARLVRHSATVVPAIWHKTHSIGWAVGGVFLETVAGAVILGTLTALPFKMNPELHYGGEIGIAVAIGAMLGLMVGICNHWQRSQNTLA